MIFRGGWGSGPPCHPFWIRACGYMWVHVLQSSYWCGDSWLLGFNCEVAVCVSSSRFHGLIYYPCLYDISLMEEEGSKYHCKQAIIGPLAKRHLNADGGPKLNAGLIVFWFFRGSGPTLLRNPMFFMSFRDGWGSGPPCPPFWIRAWGYMWVLVLQSSYWCGDSWLLGFNCEVSVCVLCLFLVVPWADLPIFDYDASYSFVCETHICVSRNLPLNASYLTRSTASM